MTEFQPSSEIAPLTLAQRKHGKRYYYSYALFNSLSYAALAEAVVLLMLLRLGGTASWVGAVSAMAYATLPFMVLGYRSVRKIGLARNAGLFWALRSLFAGFMIAAPWAQQHLGGNAGLWFVLAGATGFFTARAVGMVSFMGILTELTTPREKGALIANSFMLFQGGGLLMTVLIALFLGVEASLYRYQLFFTAGLLTGLAAAYSLWKLPESGAFRQGAPFSLRRELGWLVGTGGRRWFFAMMAVIPITQGILRMFIVLVAKQGYGLSDQQVVLYVLTGIIGGIAASYAYGMFLDKLGSRPLLVLTGIADIGAVLGILILPVSISPIFLGALFFISGAVHIAFQASLQHYFLSITDVEHQLPQGIITQSVGGIAGGLALYLGGVGLEAIEQVVASPTDPLLHFRWFYGGMLVLLVLRTAILFRIPRLRSEGIRDSLNALLSPWDWRAVNAVKRAVAIQSEDEETRSLDFIMRSGSGIYREELESLLQSPSFVVRERALVALALVKPDMPLIDALLEDVRGNPFTTAPQAAYWLGHWQVKRAVHVLREAVGSADETLSARAIQALVEVEDRESLPMIRERFQASLHALVIVCGARALAQWDGAEAYPRLLEKLNEPVPPQARDELALSVARLAGLYDMFYRDLGMLRRQPEQLFSEWRERYGARDGEALLASVRAGSVVKVQLEQALAANRDSFREWFQAGTEAWLARSPESIAPHLGFLMTFLLLSPAGNHLA
ncbi:MAG: hypothetical protein O7E56_09415 [SAR324 cluster bacterium]|nr:hypothetical protein [SAR324 cluster bacterium]